MIKRILSPAKALRTLQKTPALLAALIGAISQRQAQTLRDGEDGWTILYIACHLRDYERIVAERVRQILDQERPELANMDNAALIAQNRYDEQDLRAVLTDLGQRRHAFVNLLRDLTDEQWLREGVHAEQGP